MRNRRRGESPWAPVRHWFKVHQEALTILGVCFICGALVGMFVGGWIVVTNPESWLKSTSPAQLEDLSALTVNQAPHVVTTFKCWTESPKGNSILMVWSDGQVWRARTDNGTTISKFEFLVHVRLGETP